MQDEGSRPNDEITTAVAARLLELTPQRIGQLITSGHIHRHRHGHTTISSAVRGYIRFLKEENSRNSASAELRRGQEARAREIELRTQLRAREVIPIEDARSVVADLCGMVRSEFEGLPAAYTRDLEQRRRLEQEVHARFDRLSARAEKAGAALETGGLDLEAE